MLSRVLDILHSKTEVVKAALYSALGSALSVSVLIMQRSFKPLYISSISKLVIEGVDKIIYKSSSGFLEQAGGLGSGLCTLKIILPFDIPPPAIPPVYLCSWDRTVSDRLDSLCYTDFICTAPDILTRMYIASSVLFILCYLILGSLVILSRTTKNLKWLSRRVWWVVVSIGGFSGLLAFTIGKMIPYITDSLISDVFDKINSITVNKGGVSDITYTETNYVLDTNSYISRTLIDIVSGFSVGFLFIIWEAYKKLFPITLPPTQPCQP